MSTPANMHVMFAAVILAVLLAGCQAQPGAEHSGAAGVTIGENDIGGVVTSANGPEAGVWVIAETNDLPTRIREDRRHRR